MSCFVSHFNDVIMSVIASQISGVSIVCSTVLTCRSKKHQSSAATNFCAVTGEFPAQKASNAENISIWWRHHQSNQSSNVIVLHEILCYLPPPPRSPPRMESTCNKSKIAFYMPKQIQALKTRSRRVKIISLVVIYGLIMSGIIEYYTNYRDY